MARRPNAERHSGTNRSALSPHAARSSLVEKYHLTAFTFDSIHHHRQGGKRAGTRSASRRSRFRSLPFLVVIARFLSHVVYATQRWDFEIRCSHRAHFSAMIFFRSSRAPTRTRMSRTPPTCRRWLTALPHPRAPQISQMRCWSRVVTNKANFLMSIRTTYPPPPHPSEVEQGLLDGG